MNRGLLLGLVGIVGLLLATTSIAPAQIPSGSIYAASSIGEKAGKAIVAFDASGKVTTIVPLTTGVIPASIAMAPGNRDMLVWDQNRLFRFDVLTGAQVMTTIVAPGLTAGLVDEDGGFVWTTSSGLLLKANDLACTKLVTLVNMPTHTFQNACWNGSTGEWIVAAKDNLKTSWDLLYFDSTGFITTSIVGVPAPTGLDWSPWNGHVYATYFANGGGVIEIDSKGKVTTLNVANVPARANLAGIEVCEQPREEFVCVEGGSAPQHLALLDPKGGITSLHSSSGLFDPSDVEVIGQRPLWAMSTFGLGKVGTLYLNFGPSQAKKLYQIVLSFGHTQGINLGRVGTIHLDYDALFLASILAGAPIFNHFSGTLDQAGRANPIPYVAVPNDWALYGLRVYGAAIAFDQTGVTAISNCWGATLTYT